MKELFTSFVNSSGMNMSDGKEFEMFEFFEKTPVMVCIASREGYLQKVNAAVIDKLGYSEEELYSRHLFSFMHPDDREVTQREREKLFSGATMMNFHNRYISKQGEVIWLEWNSIYVPEKQLVFAIAKDVSERKQLEKEIEEKYKTFKSLATHFKSSMEEDRKYLAVELHEELAQLSAVVKVDMDGLEYMDGMPDAAKEKIKHAMAANDILLNTISRISFSLSPNMLDDIGMNETIKWHCREFELLNGISCEFESAYDEDSLSREIKLDFFRICQEALTNVMYHAQANKVKVKIEDTGQNILLSITDDGKGFRVSDDESGSGLMNIRDRVISLNGELIIYSEPAKGTMLQVSITK